MKKIISLILLILWMIIIFILSNQNGDISTVESGKVVEFLSKIISIDLNSLTFIVRKIAHITEYLILFLLMYNYISFYNKSTMKLSIIFTLLYAIIDETHQLFINDRTGKLIDVLIDSIGILIGYIIIEVKHEKKIKKRSSTSN